MSSPCCSWCLDCCKDGDAKYEKAKTAEIDVVLPQYEKVPLDKVFEFKQPPAPLPLHPQISPASVIKQQPQPSGPLPPDAAQPTDQPAMIHFSLYYDIQRRTLTVHLLEGTNLPAKDRRGTSDPFVILFLLPHKEEIFESKVHKRTLNPVFNEVFEFSGLIPSEIRQQTLILRVLDKDFSSSEDMGTIIQPLEDADLYGVRVSCKLSQDATAYQTDSKGDVLLSLLYNPSLNIISGILLKATNLQRMDISGSADPYIKIYLLHKGSRQAKWKSSVKKNTLVPIYNEPFQFDITDMNLQDIVLDISVIDFDRLGRNDLMGIIKIGSDVDHTTGQQHWNEMLSSQRTPVSRWHSLDNPNRKGRFF